MKFLNIAVIVALVFSMTTAAQANAAPSNQDALYNQKAFASTLALCSPRNNPFVTQFKMDLATIKTIGHGFWSFFWPSNPKAMVTLSPSTSKLIHSEGYWQALENCFPQSPLNQKLFTASIIISDIEGHGIGVVAFIFSGLAVKALEGTAWALAHPVAIAWANRTLIAMGVVATLTAATDLATRIHRDHYLKKHPESAVNQEVDQANDLHDAAYQAMVDRYNQVEYELAHGLLDDHCRNFPAATRQAQCNDYLLKRQEALRYRITHQQYGKYKNPKVTTPSDQPQS